MKIRLIGAELPADGRIDAAKLILYFLLFISIHNLLKDVVSSPGYIASINPKRRASKQSSLNWGTT
jgi:hypothetical protein